MPTITYNEVYLSPEVTGQFGEQYNSQITEIFSGLRGRGANFEKLRGLPGLYSARGSRKLRFLCTPYENSFVIIGVLVNHDYDLCTKIYNAHKSIAPINFTKLSLPDTVSINVLSMAAPDIYNYGTKYDYSPVIFLSDQQDDILTEIERYSHQHPLFINGIAGTGKTTIAQYLLKGFRSDEKVLYICRDEFLAREQQRQFDLMIEAEQPVQEDLPAEPLHQTSGEIDSDTSSSNPDSDSDSDSDASVETPNIQFKHIKQLYQELGLIAPEAQLESFTDFDKWLRAIISDRKHSLNKITRSLEMTDTYLYAEFKAMMSRGLTLEHQDTYQKLPLDLSSFSPEARENVFVLYSSYLNYLSANNITVIELIPPAALSEIKAVPFDRIIVDETQLFAYTILKNLQSLCDSKLLMFGDYNQGKFYFRTKVLAESFPGLRIINLSHNQRCSQPVVDFANSTLELQRQYIGGEFEDNTVLSLVHMRKDEPPTSCAKFLDIPNLVAHSSLANNGDIFYIVNNDSDEEKLKAMLGAGIAVLKDTEVCGLEFENVVLYNLIAGHHTSQEYVEIAKYFHSQDQTEADSGHRHKPKDKKEASARIKNIEKFRYLFLLITRARDSIYLVDDKKHPFVQQLVASAKLTDHVHTESELHEKCDAPNLSIIVHLLHGSQSQKRAIDLLRIYISEIDNPHSSLILSRIQHIIATKPDFRFSVDSLHSLVVTNNEQELDDEIHKLFPLDQQSTKDKEQSKSKAKASKPAPLHTVQSLIDQAEASPSAESTPKPESEKPALIKLFMTSFGIHKVNAAESLYATIARSRVTYMNSSYSNVSSIKKLLFSNFPRNLTPPKSKGKSASQAITISIGGQQITQQNYVEGKFTLSPEFREIEIETISSVFNRPIIVLVDDQASGQEIIRDYGLGCPSDPIVLLHNKLNDAFILLVIPNIKTIKQSLLSFISEYKQVKDNLQQLVEFVTARNEQLSKDRSTPPPAPSTPPSTIQAISRTGSQNKEKDKNTATPGISSQLTRTHRDIISLKAGQRITFNADGSRTVSQASGQQTPSHVMTPTNNPKLDDYLARQDLTIQIVLHFLHQMSMPNLDSTDELRRKYKHNTNIQMIVVAALMYLSQHGDATMILKLLDVSHDSSSNILLAFDHAMHWGQINVLLKLFEQYGSTTNPYGEKYSAYLLRAVARRGCSTSLARIFALGQTDAADMIITIETAIESEHHLLANDLIESFANGLDSNSKEMSMLLIMLAQRGLGSYLLKILNTGKVQDRDAMISLIQASQNNHQEAVAVILQHYNTSVDEKGEKSLTSVFIISAEMGYTFLVAQMLQHCNFETRHLYEALAKAAERGRSEVVLELIDDKRIDINKASPEAQQTLLHTAAASGNVPFVNALLYGHADPNLTDKNGHTPLMLAVFNGHIDVVKRLLQEESTVITILCPDGKTLIEKAAELNNWVIHDLLSAALDELVNDIPRGDLDYSGDEVASDCDNLSNGSVALKARFR